MTVADFKDNVVSYSNRIAALYTTVGSKDIVIQAMNDVRLAAQRRYKFNLAKQWAFAPLSLKPVSLLSDFKTTPGGSTTVVVNRLDSLWEYGTTSVSSTTVYYPTKELDIRSMAELGYAVPARPWPTQGTDVVTMSTFAYKHGTNLYHSNLTTPTSFMASVVGLLPDLVVGDTPDFFLTYFSDWLKFATLMSLNIWLKDSERFQFDAQMMTTLWDSVTQFDSQQQQSGPITLD